MITWNLEFFQQLKNKMAGKEWGRFYVTGMKQAPTICILWIRTKTSTQQVQPPANMPHDKNNTQIKSVHHHKIKEQNCGFSYEWINRKKQKKSFSVLVDCNARVVGGAQTPKLWVLWLCRLITPLYGLGLRSFQLQSCSPRWDLSNTMCVLISFCNAFSSSPWEMDHTSRSFYSWTKRKGRRYG